MTSELYRWQAGMGVIAGALVADAMATASSTWTPATLRSIDIAESMLSGVPVPIDLPIGDALVVAVGLSCGPVPLLLEPETAALVELIRDGLAGDRLHSREPVLAKALEIARSANFRDAVALARSDPDLARLVGAIAGLDGGLGAIPARPVSTLRAADGRRGRRYLCALTNRLLGMNRPSWYDPRNRRGPREVLPGVWLSNLYGLSRFTAEHPDGLVLSLCDDEGRVAGHPHHLTFHVEDVPRTDANPSLEHVVDEILDEIAAARATKQPVLVHCRHGASRTGLILRVLLVTELGLSAEEALVEAQCLWPHTSDWNGDWTREVERRALRA